MKNDKLPMLERGIAATFLKDYCQEVHSRSRKFQAKEFKSNFPYVKDVTQRIEQGGGIYIYHNTLNDRDGFEIMNSILSSSSKCVISTMFRRK